MDYNDLPDDPVIIKALYKAYELPAFAYIAATMTGDLFGVAEIMAALNVDELPMFLAAVSAQLIKLFANTQPAPKDALSEPDVSRDENCCGNCAGCPFKQEV